MPPRGLQSTFKNRRKAPDHPSSHPYSRRLQSEAADFSPLSKTGAPAPDYPSSHPYSRRLQSEAADFSPLSKTGAPRLTTSSHRKAAMPPRGLQSTFQNRRKAPDHFLPIITQGFNPGRPYASEGFSPGRLWETLGGPVRRRTSVLGLGPAP